MIADGTHPAVLDRFEEKRAVLIVEVDGEDAEQVVVHRTWLPPAARTQDAVLRVTVEDGKPVALDYDPDEAASRSEAAQDRFDRLARRPPGAEETGEGDETDEVNEADEADEETK